MLSLRKYAESRKARNLPGGSLRAVQKAIEYGRIAAATARDERGALKIADPALADRLWKENTDDSLRRDHVAESEREQRAAGDGAGEPEPEGKPAAGGPAGVYQQARAAKEAIAARKARLEYERLAGILVNAEEVAKAWRDVIGVSRNKVLGVPSKAKQRMPERVPELSVAQINSICAMFDQLLREALEDLAENGAQANADGR